MAEPRTAGVRFEHRMSDFEALMWTVEKDPWLNPSGGAITVYDRPPDVADFRRRLAYAVTEIPRLREKVVPGVGRLSPPHWAPDPEFDLDHHLRHVALPPPGSERQLYDLAARLQQDPFDRTRPLWVCVVIDGLEGGRGAMFAKLHHTIADGYAALRLSELWGGRERHAPPPPEVDLGQVVAEAVAAERRSDGFGPGPMGGFAAATMTTAGHMWRRQLGRTRRVAGEVLIWGADPRRPLDRGSELLSALRQTRGQLGGGEEVSGGSPLWRHRSRHRAFEFLRLPLDPVRATAKALGGTVNDVFVTGAVLGSIRYHEGRETPPEAFNISFVVSTRGEDGAGGNAFAPTRVQVPAAPMPVEARFAAIHDRLASRRRGAHGAGIMGTVAGLANLLPTSFVTGVARAQTAHMDFATSNLRGSPVPFYQSGAKMLWTGILGPVAGTSFNLTAISYEGSLDIGLHVDPIAVEEPGDLRICIEEGYTELLAAGGHVLRGATVDHDTA